jgi:nucleoside-diphosphate-sugar epimerase
MKVVVTGGTGQLGRRIVDGLVAAGHAVVVASRARGGLSRLGHDVRALCLDITDDVCVNVLAPELESGTALVHLAGYPPFGPSAGPSERALYVETHVLGTMRVLDAARGRGVAVVVYASVAAPLDTDHAVTKRSGEDHVLAFGAEENVRVVTLSLPELRTPDALNRAALAAELALSGRVSGILAV